MSSWQMTHNPLWTKYLSTTNTSQIQILLPVLSFTPSLSEPNTSQIQVIACHRRWAVHNVFVMQWSKSQRFIMVDPLSLHHAHLNILANWIWISSASQGKVKTITTHHHLLRWKTKGKTWASSELTYQRYEILRWFAASFNSMNMQAHHVRAAGGWSMINSIYNSTCEDRRRFAIVSCNRGTQ